MSSAVTVGWIRRSARHVQCISRAVTFHSANPSPFPPHLRDPSVPQSINYDVPQAEKALVGTQDRLLALDRSPPTAVYFVGTGVA